MVLKIYGTAKKEHGVRRNDVFVVVEVKGGWNSKIKSVVLVRSGDEGKYAEEKSEREQMQRERESRDKSPFEDQYIGKDEFLARRFGTDDCSVRLANIIGRIEKDTGKHLTVKDLFYADPDPMVAMRGFGRRTWFYIPYQHLVFGDACI